MATIKCNVCGGSAPLIEDKSFGTCEYCGSLVTFPKIDNEARLQAFNRGNQFRLNGDFEEALRIYEHLVEEDPTDAEAHWCCALCRFGIEYVEDPAAFEWIPTCHRASFDSFLQDVDYLAAVENALGLVKTQYQKMGAKIAEVQKGILATSQNEEPFDVFICYKETDAAGRRTADSVLAQDIYYQLTEKGYRVFFARITLENVLGAQYEPYIFAALNSAKVMLCIGTKAEHFNAVWVKNEWSRFKALMKKDRSKILIPCYRDMDPYNLPEELKILQSHDMGKIGFLQDLLHGIAKLFDRDKKPEAPAQQTVVTVESDGGGIAPLLKRAFLFLEDGNWDEANEYAEKVLDRNPECAEAYLAKLLAKLRLNNKKSLAGLAAPFHNEPEYKKVLRYADKKLEEELLGYLKRIQERIEEKKKADIYNKAKSLISTGQPQEVHNGVLLLKKIPGYRDADALILEYQSFYEEYYYKKGAEALQCNTLQKLKFACECFHHTPNYKDSAQLLAQAEALIKEKNRESEYKDGIIAMRQGSRANLQDAIGHFRNVKGYKDSEELIRQCNERLDEIRNEEEAAQERERLAKIAAEKAARAAAQRKRILTISIIALIIAAIAGAVIWYVTVAIPQQEAEKYEAAEKAYAAAAALEQAGKIEEAAIAFAKLDGHKDAMSRSLALWDTFADRQTVTIVNAGSVHCFGIRDDGTLAVHSSSESFKQCASWKDLISIETDDFHLIALTKDHKVLVANYMSCDCKRCKKAPEMENVVQILKNGYLCADGTLYDTEGYEKKDPWVDLACVKNCGEKMIGFKANGAIVTSGSDYSGIEKWRNIKRFSMSYSTVVGLTKEGTVVLAGNTDEKQLAAAQWDGLVDVVIFKDVIYGLKKDGSVVKTSGSIEPLKNVAKVIQNSDSSVFDSVFFLLKDGSVYEGKISSDSTPLLTGIRTPSYETAEE